MSWPIPDIPERSIVPSLHYKKWIIALFVMIPFGVLIAVFPAGVKNYNDILFYGVIPVVLFWLCLFGGVFYYHVNSVNKAILWNEETRRTKQRWQQWSRKQHNVVGNIILTAEENGINALLGNLTEVPAYPEKARPLFTHISGMAERLEFIDREYERELTGYRHHLYRIVVQCSAECDKKKLAAIICQQWNISPEFSDIAMFFSEDDKNTGAGLTMFLCLQYWDNTQITHYKYSEFITSQLVVANSFVRENIFPVIAGMGRRLFSDSLTGALDMLYEYNRLEKEKIHYVWVSGMDGNDRMQIIQYITSKKGFLPEKHPLISLDHSFGPSGPMIFSVMLSLLTDAAISTGEMQLCIVKNHHNLYSLCLITRKLL